MVPFVKKDISDVINRIKHAALSRFPRKRYAVGNYATLFVFVKHLPTIVEDFVKEYLFVRFEPEQK